jgi:hypothetical protein
MVIGLKHNILKMLREQAPTPAPPAAAPPPAPVDPNAPPAAPSVPGTPVDPNAPPVDPNAPPVDPNAPPSDGAEGEEDDGAESPEGQPKVDENDPVGAVEEAALETAKTTIDPQLILNSVKASMQANFGDKMEDAWPVVQRLKDAENVVLGDVAKRLSLFINGTIQMEHRNKGKRIMNANKGRPANNFKITEAQLARIIKNTAKRLHEETMFDALKTQLDQERNDIESRMSGNEVKKMALEFFEKLCQKAGLDSATLTPQAKEYVNTELQTMVHSIQDVGSKLSHVARVINAAGEKSEGKAE